MTGTSLDGLDAALVEIKGCGLGMIARMLDCVSLDLGPAAANLRLLADQVPMSAGMIAATMHEFSLAHVQAIRTLVDSRRVDLICVHGQTVFHSPPISWQLMQPAPIVAAFGCPVVFDLRASDLARGGQGAPITPIADFVLLAAANERRCVVNLGGFANFTMLPESTARNTTLTEQIDGGDICACNQLLDAIARERLGVPFDRDGEAALNGKINSAAVEKIAGLRTWQSGEGRSLGTGDEAARELYDIVPAPAMPGPDVARAACSAIARAIAARVRTSDRVLLAGGGAKNNALVQALQRAIPCPVSMTDEFGVSGQFREAICFAVLGALCQDRVPITLPRITKLKGAAPISGAWVGLGGSDEVTE
jgi:1,6-anhydro-N-acetylmuramate kinase